MKLTIAIPTYNRNEILCRNIVTLLPQLDSDCELLIIDNCSKTPVTDTLKTVLQQYPNIKVRLIRNRVNIGGSSNIMRCFEECQTEWLWLLGDDDGVADNAVKTIINSISKYKDVLFINFMCNLFTRIETMDVQGIEDFLDNLDYFGNLLSISVNVFHLSKIIKYLQYGYHYCYSCGPHVAMMLRGIQENERVILSNEIIIIKIVTNGISDYWSLIPVGLGIYTLIENVKGIEAKNKLNTKIYKLLNNGRLVYELLFYMSKGIITKKEVKYYYKQIMYRQNYFGHNSIKNYVIFLIARISLELGVSGIKILNLCCDIWRIPRFFAGKNPF